MTSQTLELDNRDSVLETLDRVVESEGWIVACLCAAWCDVCCASRAGFDDFAARHPDKQFLWIDIEDHADVVGDLDVENFPTLLIQRGNTVAFYGTILPDWSQAHRLLQAQVAKSVSELLGESRSTPEKIRWQEDNNLHRRLQDCL